MNKSDIVKEILNKNKKYKFSEIEKIVDLFFKEITKALIEGRRTEIRGFGAFFILMSIVGMLYTDFSNKNKNAIYKPLIEKT